MTITRSDDQTKHLKLLGGEKSLQYGSAPGVHILETFPNLYPHHTYVISIMFPEYTSLCPVTGQPDFATIVFEYIPNACCIESKSFKIYMGSFRNHHSFMETVTNKILEDMVQALDPLWCRVKGLFAPRGATHLHVFAEHYKAVVDKKKMEHIKTVSTNWKQEVFPHSWK